MGLAGITIRTMPDSPSADLEALKEKLKGIVESEGGKIIDHVEEPVAFGLKAVITKFKWDETKESEKIVGMVEKLEGINSCQVTDVRRMVQ
jgi:translation elongation factor aEF-1 beta